MVKFHFALPFSHPLSRDKRPHSFDVRRASIRLHTQFAQRPWKSIGSPVLTTLRQSLTQPAHAPLQCQFYITGSPARSMCWPPALIRPHEL